MFASLSEDSVKVDIDALEAAFSANAPANPNKKAAKKVETLPTFLDPKRANNIGIMIARLKMTGEEVCRAIEECDEAALPEETLTILRACVPTPDEDTEIEMFRAHTEANGGDISKVGKPETFQLEVGKMPRVRERIDLLCWLHEYKEKMDGLQPDVAGVVAALKSLKESDSFAELLKIILAVGNYMNGGSFRGGAAGFKIDALGKLTDVRSTTQKGKTLLDFVVKFTQQNHPAVADKFAVELEEVNRGAKVPYSNIAIELASLVKSMKLTIANMGKIEAVAEKMHSQLKARVGEYEKRIKEMESEVAEMEKLRIEVLLRFGEDPKSGEIGELFQAIVSFVASWETAAAASLEAEAAAGKGGGSGDSAATGGAAAAGNDNKIDDKMAQMKAGNFRRRAGAQGQGSSSGGGGGGGEDASARAKELERERLRR